jgi:hypothetical protein
VTQFSSRLIFCPTEHMEELNIDYWFHNVCEEDDILPANLSKLDVDNLVLQCLPSETNIGLDCKRLLTLSSSPQSNREKNLSATCFRTRRVEMIDSGTGRADKKIFNKCKYSAIASFNISITTFVFFSSFIWKSKRFPKGCSKSRRHFPFKTTKHFSPTFAPCRRFLGHGKWETSIQQERSIQKRRVHESWSWSFRIQVSNNQNKASKIILNFVLFFLNFSVRGHYSFYKPNFRGRFSRGSRGRGFVR